MHLHKRLPFRSPAWDRKPSLSLAWFRLQPWDNSNKHLPMLPCYV